jgi:hypothetical protein
MSSSAQVDSRIVCQTESFPIRVELPDDRKEAEAKHEETCDGDPSSPSESIPGRGH